MPEITIQNISGENKNGKHYEGFKFIAGDYESPMFFPDKIHSDYLLKNFFPEVD